MGRIVIFVIGAATVACVMNPGLLPTEGLQDKLLLVAILPGVYILGICLLGD